MAQAQQNDGWPLGLRMLNGRVGILGNRNFSFSESISFDSLLTASHTPFTDSSDLDSQSSGSISDDKSITLGGEIGASGIVEQSRRSSRERTVARATLKDTKNKNHLKPKPWLLSLCCKLSTDAVIVSRTSPSLAHFLAAERRNCCQLPDEDETQS